MSKVRFLPSNKEVEAQPGENLLGCAMRAGVSIKCSCGGVPTCAMCHIVVVKGEASLTGISDKEVDLLGNTYFLTKKRLSCQAKVVGSDDLTIEVPNEESGSAAEPSSFRKPSSQWRKPGEKAKVTGRNRDKRNSRSRGQR